MLKFHTFMYLSEYLPEQLESIFTALLIYLQGNNLTPLTHACVLGLSQSIEILLSSGARPDGLPGV